MAKTDVLRIAKAPLEHLAIEQGGSVTVVEGKQCVEVVRRRLETVSAVTEVLGVRVDEPDSLAGAAELLDERRQRAGKEKVVGVEGEHVASSGALEGNIAGSARSPVGGQPQDRGVSFALDPG